MAAKDKVTEPVEINVEETTKSTEFTAAERKQIDEALLNGQPIPFENVAVDFAVNPPYRRLTSAEAAAHRHAAGVE